MMNRKEFYEYVKDNVKAYLPKSYEAVSYTHLDVYKRQVLCTASKARTWIWKLYNYKDWRQSGVSKRDVYKRQMPQEARVFSLINTQIFQKEKDSSLFIWLHHMPTEVVMHFTEPMLQLSLIHICIRHER